jgi:uncharacterized protein (TIGR00369 family)
MQSPAAPDGFQPHGKRSPVTDPWQPLYARRHGGSVQLGVWLGEAHLNSRGLLHGGVIAALADNAMGLSCLAGQGAAVSALTVSLSIDYLASAKSGQWLQIDPRVVKRGSTLAFVDAMITADAVSIARATAVFRMLS